MWRCDQVLSAARGVLIVLIANVGAASAAAENSLCDLPLVERVTATLVVDGATFDLDDGRQVRLASVLVPSAGEPQAAEALRHLTMLVAGKPVGLALDEQAVDRHGRLLAHVFVGDDWIQRAMVGAGSGRVRTHTGSDRCAEALLAEEGAARGARRGLWALPHYRVRSSEELEDAIGTFQIVEGRVAAVAVGRARVYVNFGADYRGDFTVTIAPGDARRLAKQGVDPKSWAGRKVRVRGWLSRLNGPEMELTHAAQIQILE
jgi:endonuclease YncB( thermonuclease family)